MNVFLPHRGEFGLKVVYHVPAVHALTGPKIVMHEPGEEALYPSATTLMEVPRADDDTKRGHRARGDAWTASAVSRWPDATVVETHERMRRSRFVPEPYEPQGVSDVDIVVCPRWRRYGSTKNWHWWPSLTGTLLRAGVRTFAGGERETSCEVEGNAAWHYRRPLDATIEAMRKARLVVATDAGLAHLALLCGAPLLLITYGPGLTAPGPVLDADGKRLAHRYGPVKAHRYAEGNHRDTHLEFLHFAWEDPDMVRRRTLELLR